MFSFSHINKDFPVVLWFSGGVTSTIACKVALDLFGKENCILLFIDTKNEDPDTYRFLKDCEKWFGMKAKILTAVGENKEYSNIQDVWRKYKSLNVAKGAICSTELKRAVREKWQKENAFSYQVFGFDTAEPNRANAMTLNHPDSKPLYPLLFLNYSKPKCIEILQENGIEIPLAYKLGFENNNCLETGCVQGGIGYWQKMQRDFPDKFKAMAREEHFLTHLKGEPVTMLKDQSKEAKKLVKETGNKALQRVFLLPHPRYPNKDISMMEGRPPKPLSDCNGFCGINDLQPRSSTEEEINYTD